MYPLSYLVELTIGMILQVANAHDTESRWSEWQHIKLLAFLKLHFFRYQQNLVGGLEHFLFSHILGF